MGRAVVVERFLIIMDGTFESYGKAWARGLGELGYTVETFDWSSCWSLGALGRLERRFLLGPAIDRVNRGVHEAVSTLKPEVVMVYGRSPLRPSTVARLSRAAWITSYQNDDLFGGNGKKSFNRYARGSLRHFHSHHVYHEQNVADYRACGVQAVRPLRSYYLPWIDSPPRLSAEDFERYRHDLVFAGHSEPDERIGHVMTLLQGGFGLRIYGEGRYWRRHLPVSGFRKVAPIRPVFGAEYRKVLAASKISLCFLSRANRDRYTRRVFEIPAVGGFLLCERTDAMRELYREGAEAEFFESSEELSDKARFYLAHEDIRNRIAEAGRRRCLSSGYDIYSRIKQWLADLNEWRSQVQ
jgi:hypothetical protein